MKKTTLIVLLTLVTSIVGNAQEKMKVELKNGEVVTYNVDDLNRFYFVTEEEEDKIAENCGIILKDELVLTTDFALEMQYESEVENVLWIICEPEANVDELTDAELLDFMLTEGNVNDKSKTILTGQTMPEDTELTIVYVGLNANGEHGHLYRHKVKTHSEANEPQAPVTCMYNNTMFIYSVEIDPNVVMKYYYTYSVGDNLTIVENMFGNMAAFGMMWRRLIAENPDDSVSFESSDEIIERNGATQFHVCTWAVDHNSKFSNFIFEGFFDVGKKNAPEKVPAQMRTRTGTKSSQAYSKSELEEMVKNMRVRTIEKKK